MSGLFSKGQTIVCDGDSLCRRGPETWPFLRIAGWNASWADAMAELFFVTRPDLQLSMHNVAVGGSVCFDIDARYPDKVKPQKPDWVMLSLGTNDANREIPYPEIKQCMDQYCQRLAADSGGRVIYVPMPDLADEADPNTVQAFNKKRRSMYRVIAKSVTKHDGIVLDINKSFQRKAKLLRKQSHFHQLYGDGCHFSELGNRLICNEVLNALGYGMLND